MTPKTLMACGLLAATALAGCGSGLSISAASAGPGDRQLARRAVLDLNDFPKGWKRGSRADQQSTNCPGAKHTRKTATANAVSPPFSSGDDTQATGAVYVFPTAKIAAKGFKVLSGRELRRCYADALTKAIVGDRQLQLKSLKTAPLELDPVNAEHAAARITITVSSALGDETVYIDLVYVRTRRALALGQFIDVSTPFDETLRAQLTAAQVRRLSAGLH
jgi:hypothetical protein